MYSNVNSTRIAQRWRRDVRGQCMATASESLVKLVRKAANRDLTALVARRHDLDVCNSAVTTDVKGHDASRPREVQADASEGG